MFIRQPCNLRGLVLNLHESHVGYDFVKDENADIVKTNSSKWFGRSKQNQNKLYGSHRMKKDQICIVGMVTQLKLREKIRSQTRRAMMKAAKKKAMVATPAKAGQEPVSPMKKPPAEAHECPNCGKLFSSAGKLHQHSFVHTGERPFKCSNCEKSFSSKFKLMRHSLIHSGERKYGCTFCERCFHRKDHLKNHLQVHNPNKKVHRCEQCSKEYNSRLSFRKHIAVHAAEAGDLNCKVCSKDFATSAEILYHLKVHTGSRTVKNPSEKKFQCEFCERRFFTRKDVKRHLVVHTGRRDFLCQFCPQRFGRKDHLVRHIKKGHVGTTTAIRTTNPFISSSHSKRANVDESSNFEDLNSLNPADSERTGNLPFETTTTTIYTPIQYSEIPGTSAVTTLPTVHLGEPSSSTSTAVFTSADFKSFDDIKSEKVDDDMTGIFDTGQIFSFIPLSVHGVSTVPSETHLLTSSMEIENLEDASEGVLSLPRFSQAFQ